MTPQISRRGFLKIGVIPFLGLNLPQYFSANHKKGKSVIFFYLRGGMSHIDTYDPKPDAPAEIRGIYKSINTIVPEINFSELLPKQAAIADKLTIIRSLTHSNPDHASGEQFLISGHDTYPSVRHPCFASIATKLMENENKYPLPYLVLGSKAYNWMHGVGDNRLLKKTHDPLFISKSPNEENFNGVEELSLSNGLTLFEFLRRKELLDQLDLFKKKFSGPVAELETHYQKVFQILSGSGITKAFNIDEETRGTCDFYGRTDIGQRALLARRLIEAGTLFVTIETGIDLGWDFHSNIFNQMNTTVPAFDKAISALIIDLNDLNMLDDVLVIAFGEFGRTPRINKNAGRDHWPKASSVLIAGLDTPRGKIYGASNSKGEEIKEKPISPKDLLATIYKKLGFPPETIIEDKNSRRHFISEGVPINL